MTQETQAYLGLADISAGTSDFNLHTFLFWQLMGKVWTTMPVQVMAVTAGGVGPVGTVSVKPMVNQLDGSKNAVPHGTIYAIPYFRMQGGANAIIIDPEVGDIGLMLCAMRDTSSVRANKAAANPGTSRRFDPADGFYIGGFLNGVPSNYVQCSSAGITVLSTSIVTVQAPTINLEGNVAISQNLTVMGESDLKGGAGMPIETTAGPSTTAKA